MDAPTKQKQFNNKNRMITNLSVESVVIVVMSEYIRDTTSRVECFECEVL